MQIREALTKDDIIAQQALQLREAASVEALRLEDYNWKPIGNWNKDSGFDLRTIKEEAWTCQQMYAINPMIKKAVLARVGMIHGKGTRIVATEETQQEKVDSVVAENKKRIFGSVARAQLEATLSTDGNVFVLKVGNEPAKVIPLDQIEGFVTDVDETDSVLYWKRSYTTQETNLITGDETNVVVNEYIPTPEAKTVVANIGDTPVRTNARMYHIKANAQRGWVLGLPDLFAAKFWTRGHKEMFEAGHEFALAQGQIAAKVTTKNDLGANLAAARLADMPRRDPETGEPTYGGTAVMSNGLDLQLMGKMGSGVDFKAYDRIAGLIAVGTGVPVDVLLGEADSEEKSLEQSVVEDMKLRQALWGEFYEELLNPISVQAVWPRIKQETVYRVQQALEISNRTGKLHGEELRRLALEAWGIEGDAADLPDIMDHPDVQVYEAKKKLDLEYAPLIAEASMPQTEGEESEEDEGRSTVNDQGNDQGLGKLSDGEDAHDARDNGEQEHTR